MSRVYLNGQEYSLGSNIYVAAAGSSAATTSYDNTQSGLSGRNVQDAIDELVENRIDNDAIGDEYSPLSPYSKGDIVIHNNTIYIANTDISTPEVWNVNHWTQTTITELIQGVTYTEVTGTLTAGSTSVTLQNAAIHTTSTIDIYTGVYTIMPTDAQTTEGQIVLTFDEQSSNLSVKVKVWN